VLVLNDLPARSFPLNIAADDRFRGMLLLARDMCADGRLNSQGVAVQGVSIKTRVETALDLRA